MKLDAGKAAALRRLLGEMIKESAQFDSRSAKLRDMDINASRAARTSAYARLTASAEHIERMKHEAHCLAVELGIADRRSDAHYGQHEFADSSSFCRRAPERAPAA